MKIEIQDLNCEHENIEWGDDDEQGVCLDCGKKCNWHWITEWLDEGHDEDGGCIGRQIKVREIIDWE